jgi:hypothetical protein
MPSLHKVKYLLVALFIACPVLFACGIGASPTPDSPISPLPGSDSSTSPLPTPVGTADPTIGLSQGASAPLGHAVVADDGVQITVLEVRRDAEDELIEMDPFNATGPDQEVVIVRVRAELIKRVSSKFTLLPFDFDIADGTGAIYPYPLTVIVRGELAAEFIQPTAVEGLLAFRIPHGCSSLFLRYSPKGRPQTYEPRWLALQ